MWVTLYQFILGEILNIENNFSKKSFLIVINSLAFIAENKVEEITQINMDYLKFPEIEYLSDSGRGSIASIPSEDEIFFDPDDMDSNEILLEKSHVSIIQLPNGRLVPTN